LVPFKHIRIFSVALFPVFSIAIRWERELRIIVVGESFKWVSLWFRFLGVFFPFGTL
jgi:hypothetical protein